ncbi:hypothetical protein FRC03_010659 [Tulasnella sp. 419]|nr:hypothetical protein FRC03_010659 [Tulasnella sp. 419]
MSFTSDDVITQRDLSGKIVKDERMGCGGFSDVWCGRLRTGDGEVKIAIKELRIQQSTLSSSEMPRDERLKKRCIREVLLWEKLEHPNIVPLLGFSMDEQGVPALISPWYFHGNIVQYLQAHTDANRRSLALDAAEGLKYLHSIPVVHGDIKGENVLVNAQGRASLCDFGTSQFIEEAARITGFTTSQANAGGTDRFLSPETVEDGSKTLAADMWAFSCLTGQILTGRIPYSGVTQKLAILLAIKEGRIPMHNDDEKIDKKLWDCLQGCWNTAPERRPVASEVCGILADVEQEPDLEISGEVAITIVPAHNPASVPEIDQDLGNGPVLPDTSMESHQEPELTVTPTDRIEGHLSITGHDTNTSRVSVLTSDPGSPLDLEAYPIYLRCPSSLSNSAHVPQAMSNTSSQSVEMPVREDPSASSSSNLEARDRGSILSTLSQNTVLSPLEEETKVQAQNRLNYSIFKPLPPLPDSRPASPTMMSQNGATLVRRRTSPLHRPSGDRQKQHYVPDTALSRRRTLAHTSAAHAAASGFSRPTAQPVTYVAKSNKLGPPPDSSKSRPQLQDLLAARKRWAMYEPRFGYCFVGL